MADDGEGKAFTLRSGRKIAVGDQWLEIRDAGEQAKFVDVITEARHHNGIVSLSVGTAIVDGNNEGLCDVVSRLRMSLGTAQVIHSLLGQIIGLALAPTETATAN